MIVLGGERPLGRRAKKKSWQSCAQEIVRYRSRSSSEARVQNTFLLAPIRALIQTSVASDHPSNLSVISASCRVICGIPREDSAMKVILRPLEVLLLDEVFLDSSRFGDGSITVMI